MATRTGATELLSRRGRRRASLPNDTPQSTPRGPSRKSLPSPDAIGVSNPEDFTLGVEEEFLLVDAESRRLRPRAEEVLHDAGSELGGKGQLDQEFKQSQVEHGTSVCHTL